MQQWLKLGSLYNPKPIAHCCDSFSTKPVVEHVSADFFRIYFSARDHKSRSHVHSVLVQIGDTMEVVDAPESRLLEPGSVGFFDDCGTVTSFICNNDFGDTYLYYVGWSLASTVPFRLALGLAIRAAGEETFRKFSDGPILDRSRFDPCLVGSNCIIRDGQQWQMWYTSGTDWISASDQLSPRYHLKYADSDDGVNWNRTGKIAIDYRDDTETCITSPMVVKDGNIFKMWFCARGEKYKIQYAESSDGLSWERQHDQCQIAGVEPSVMTCYPNVFMHKGRTFMLFNEGAFGKDGIFIAVLEA